MRMKTGNVNKVNRGKKEVTRGGGLTRDSQVKKKQLKGIREARKWVKIMN